jgi:hypothetical protein
MGLGKTALNPIVHVSEFKLSVKFQPEFTKYGLFEVTKLQILVLKTPCLRVEYDLCQQKYT